MLVWLVIGLLLATAIPTPAQQIPPVPRNQSFSYDAAELFDAATLRRIREIQREAFETHQTPIIVITIKSMAQYQWTGAIESFAKAWFDAWGIGSRENNRGILLLISTGDRSARIELGADWGRRWDNFTLQIMDNRIIPEFKAGQYGAGTIAGLEALLEMARLGPEAAPPEQTMMNQVNQAWQSNEPLTPVSPIPARIGIPMIAIGLLCLVLAIFFPDWRKLLLWIAGVLIIGSLALWVLVVIFGLINRGRGGYGASGGFGGGFSGGGGASGRW